jgi:hypothetical protein
VQALVRRITGERDIAFGPIMDILKKHEHYGLQSSLQQLSTADRLVETVVEMVMSVFSKTRFCADHTRLLKKVTEASVFTASELSDDADMMLLVRDKSKMNKVTRSTGRLCAAYRTLLDIAAPCVEASTTVEVKTKDELLDKWEVLLTHELFDDQARKVADAISEICVCCDIAWQSSLLASGPGLTDGLSTIMDTTKIVMDMVWYMPRAGKSGNHFAGLLIPVDNKWPGSAPLAVPTESSTEIVPNLFIEERRRKRPRTVADKDVPPSIWKELNELQPKSVYSPTIRLFSPQREFVFDHDAISKAWIEGVGALSSIHTSTSGDMGSLPRTDVLHDNQQLIFNQVHANGTPKPLCAMSKWDQCTATLSPAAPGPLPPFLLPAEEASWKTTGVFPRPNGLCLLCLRKRWQQIVLFFGDRVQNPIQQHAPLLLPPAHVSVNEAGGYCDKYIVNHPMAGASFPGVSNTLRVRYAADVGQWYFDQGAMVFVGYGAGALN